MELRGNRIIKENQNKVWQALNDPQVLKESIAGCEEFVRVDENNYSVRVAISVGPIKANFQGKVILEKINPPSSYSIVFEGQGGMAGYAKGTAEVTLNSCAEGTDLAYVATSQVGGKLAQVGARLIEGAARKVADDFFTVFESKLSASNTSTPDNSASETLTDHKSHNFSVRKLIIGTVLITSFFCLYYFLSK